MTEKQAMNAAELSRYFVLDARRGMDDKDTKAIQAALAKIRQIEADLDASGLPQDAGSPADLVWHDRIAVERMAERRLTPTTPGPNLTKLFYLSTFYSQL